MGGTKLDILSKNGVGGLKKHEAFLRDAETEFLFAHARFTFVQERDSWYQKMAWLNDISSISGFVAGRVKVAMGEAEAKLYQTPSEIESDKLRGHGRALIEQIIRQHLPKDITHLQIPIRCRNFERDLHDYYGNLGEALRSQGIIHDIGQYSDGIAFRLRTI